MEGGVGRRGRWRPWLTLIQSTFPAAGGGELGSVCESLEAGAEEQENTSGSCSASVETLCQRVQQAWLRSRVSKAAP